MVDAVAETYRPSPVLADDDYAFQLQRLDQAGHHAGKPPNPAPIRPSFKGPAAIQSGVDRTLNSDKAYRDVVLPLGKKFRGNDLIKVTIATMTDVITKDETTDDGTGEKTSTKTEFKSVNLIENEDGSKTNRTNRVVQSRPG